MKISIVYYSGAGNTEFIAKMLKKEFSSSCLVEIDRLKEENLEQLAEEKRDILVIGFPIYELKSPQLVEEFLKKLSRKKVKVALFCTKAFMSANAIKNLQEIAHGGDNILLAYKEFFMPGSDALALFSKKNSFNEKLFKFFYTRNLGKKIATFSQEILSEKPVEKVATKWYIFLKKIVPKFAEESFYQSYENYKKKLWCLDEKCTHCIKCVGTCPKGNICFSEKIIFGDNCDLCLRCFHHCPHNAINIGKNTLDNVRYSKVNVPLK